MRQVKTDPHTVGFELGRTLMYRYEPITIDQLARINSRPIDHGTSAVTGHKHRLKTVLLCEIMNPCGLLVGLNHSRLGRAPCL
ncbi:MAG: hypothetical protein Kow00105_04420 [Phycisphaeraceae bacterium]